MTTPLRLIRPSIALASVMIATGAWGYDSTAALKKLKDPNEKVCETHQVLGSRLAVRRVCATRAEWEERRQRERDIIERTQVQRCVINPATDLCS
jgi:hypothetical protein